MIIYWVRGEFALYRGTKSWEALGAGLGVPLFYGSIGWVWVDGEVVCKDGIGLVFDKEPTVAQLGALNKEFAGYQRDYSVVPYKPGETRDLEAEVDDLGSKVQALENRLLTLESRGLS